MRIGTAEYHSTFWSQGESVARLLKARGMSDIEVLLAQSASIENAQRLEAGELDYGFMAANWIGRALQGKPPFTKPVALRMVAPMNAGPMYFITRADFAVQSMADLRGKRIAVGPKNSGVEQHAHSILGALGISFADFTPLNMDFAAGSAALKAGQIDAQLQCPIPNIVMTELDASTDLRVIPLTPEELHTVLAAHPIYRRAIMRKGSLRALTSDSVQPAVVNVLVTHQRAPDGEVADVAQALVTGTDVLAEDNPLFSDTALLFEPLRTEGAAALAFEGVPLHPGAVEGYRRAGYL